MTLGPTLRATYIKDVLQTLVDPDTMLLIRGVVVDGKLSVLTQFNCYSSQRKKSCSRVRQNCDVKKQLTDNESNGYN